MTGPSEHDDEQPNPAAGQVHPNTAVLNAVTQAHDHRVQFHGGPHDGHVRHVPPSLEDPRVPSPSVEVMGGVPPDDPNHDRPAAGDEAGWTRLLGRYRRTGEQPDEYGTWHYHWCDDEDQRPAPDEPNEPEEDGDAADGTG